MPWDEPEEYEHYLKCVYGHTVIMGRKSWEIFNKDLDTVKSIVVSHQKHIPGAVTAPDLSSALKQAEALGDVVFIAGGSSIYRESLESNYVDEMYLSTIYGCYKGDCYFPKWDPENWTVVKKDRHAKFEFVIWKNSKPTDFLKEE